MGYYAFHRHMSQCLYTCLLVHLPLLPLTALPSTRRITVRQMDPLCNFREWWSPFLQIQHKAPWLLIITDRYLLFGAVWTPSTIWLQPMRVKHVPLRSFEHPSTYPWHNVSAQNCCAVVPVGSISWNWHLFSITSFSSRWIFPKLYSAGTNTVLVNLFPCSWYKWRGVGRLGQVLRNWRGKNWKTGPNGQNEVRLGKIWRHGVLGLDCQTDFGVEVEKVAYQGGSQNKLAQEK